MRSLVAFLRRVKGSSKGQGLVEFALVIPIILFLFLGVYEFGRLYYARLTLQYAVAEAARFAVTGETLVDDQSNPLSRAQSIIKVINESAYNLDVDVSRLTIDPSDGGGPGDVVRVSARFTFQFIVPGYRNLFPGGELDFEISTAMKNEPFIVGQGS